MLKQSLAFCAFITALAPVAWKPSLLGAPPPATEARTPISSLPYTISASGSYYVTNGLRGKSGQNGITVSGDDVTIDLNGFVLSGVPGSGHGIEVTSSRVSVLNGEIRGWGGKGVEGTNSVLCRMENLRTDSDLFAGEGGRLVAVQVKDSGVQLGIGGTLEQSTILDGWVSGGNECRLLNNNIRLGADPLLGQTMTLGKGCVINGCTVYGFHGTVTMDDEATVTDSRISMVTNVALRLGNRSSVTNCSINGQDTVVVNEGLVAGWDCVVANSTVRGGITIGKHGTIRGCTADGAAFPSIDAGENCLVLESSAARGIFAGYASRIIGCYVGSYADFPLPAIKTGVGVYISGCVMRGGVELSDRCTMTDCSVSWWSGVTPSEVGIRVASGCVVRRNSVSAGYQDEAGAGILVVGQGNHLEANTVNVTAGSTLVVSGPENAIMGNVLSGGSHSVVSGNAHGPFVDIRGRGDLAGVARTEHPLANFLN